MSEIELDRPESAQRILDTAMALAEQHGWEALRLHHVADQLQIDLEQIHSHFRQKDDLIDAWFDLADQAMLRAAASDQIKSLNPVERLQQLMLIWFQALAPHQEVTRQMIEGKLEPGHLHMQFDGVFRISRTVQWLREGALREAFFINRALEETVLTAIFVASFGQWLFDRSPHHQATRDAVSRRLRRVERFLETTQSGRLPDPFQWLSAATERFPSSRCLAHTATPATG